MFDTRKAPAGYTVEHPISFSPTSPEPFVPSCHSLQRKSFLLNAGPVNQKKDVFYVSNKDFSLDQTIFKSVSGMLGFRRLIMKAKLGNELMWKDAAAETITKDFEKFSKQEFEEEEATTGVEGKESEVRLVKTVSAENYAEILTFMQTECDFKAEHADGSFMDHLYFCRDYSAAHYKQQSPKVLFLHSILGVGTVCPSVPSSVRDFALCVLAYPVLLIMFLCLELVSDGCVQGRQIEGIAHPCRIHADRILPNHIASPEYWRADD